MTHFASLFQLGWDDKRAAELASLSEGLVAGRVAVEHRGVYLLLTTDGEVAAEASGRLRHRSSGRAYLPAVGDWVAFEGRAGDRGTIQHVLERRTTFSRNVAGKATDEQVLAANVDVAFLVASLEAEVNLRRLERYLMLAWSGGTDPVIVLNKTDLCEDPEDLVDELRRVESIALGIPVLLTSTVTRAGIDDLRDQIAGNRTAVLLGSSGTGKSSLVNSLTDRTSQPVAPVRRDGKGRHTTTRRELIPLPGGGVLLDTPGLRGLKLWAHGSETATGFSDVEQLATGCRFRDCRHLSEPGCAVKAAIEIGELSAGRLRDFHKLQRELEHQRAKQDRRLASERQRQWRAVHVAGRKSSW